ncbi:MAG: FGGY-family carbohydrate kinase [Planctomycetia bacterium]|jgi:sugar (pentulose or hexulose) kinase
MFLGLDLGTSNIKVLVVDTNGSIVGQGAASVERINTPDGGVEQDIEQIWNATCQAIRQATEQAGGRQIRAVGVSSQGGALQLLDDGNRPLGPVISWLDRRGKPFNHRLEQRLGEAYLISHTGCNFMGMTPGQILRLHEQSPALLAAARSIGFVGDVIVGRLCGRRAHDPTSLSIAMLFNPSLGREDTDLLAELGIQDKPLPDLLQATESAGSLQNDLARDLGLPGGIPVSPAVHDQYAASLGAGAVGEGDVLVGTGTAWVLLAVTGRLAPPIAKRTFVCPHPVDGLFGQLLSMGNGGSALEWVLKITGQHELDPASLDELLASVAPGAEGLLFWPLLASNEPTVSLSLPGGQLAGLAMRHSAGHLTRAVVEGMACELTRHLDWLTKAGFEARRLIMTGHAARSQVTPQVVADVADRSVTCVERSEVSSLGAAMIARSLVETGPLADLAKSLVPDYRTVVPDTNRDTYQDLFRQYVAAFLDRDRKKTESP